MQTKAIVTVPFSSIPDAAAIYPKHYEKGAEVAGYPAEVGLANGFAVHVGSFDGGAGAAMPSFIAPPTPAPEPPPSPASAEPAPPDGAQARLKKSVTIQDVNGNPVDYKRGATVDGALAAELVAQGLAVWLAPEDGGKSPPDNRSLGAAPENKA